MLEAVRYLQAWADYLGYSATIISTFRSSEEQAILYAKGRTLQQVRDRVKMQGRNGTVTDAPPGSSAHNYGLAIDVEGPDQAKVVYLAKQIGFGTVSWDPAHIEWPNWRSLVG